jgi:hypothetical protein
MDRLTNELAAIVAEVRAQVAAGRDPGADAAAQIRAAAERARGGDESGAVTRAEKAALKQLERVVAVHRARARVSREVAPAPARAAPAPRRALLRTRPTITGNMDLRRDRSGDALTLSWDAEARVTTWEVRISEQRDRGRDYVVRETRTLPGDATSTEVPLGETPLRVHVLGRDRGGRLLRRAIVSGLTAYSWNERWERRASAS